MKKKKMRLAKPAASAVNNGHCLPRGNDCQLAAWQVLFVFFSGTVKQEKIVEFLLFAPRLFLLIFGELPRS